MILKLNIKNVLCKVLKYNLIYDKLKFDKNEKIKEFYEVLDNSNFKVFKFYKLVFIKNIRNNKK